MAGMDLPGYLGKTQNTETTVEEIKE